MKADRFKYKSLPKPYKGIYPFGLGTTSFIYPDHYIPNVKMLGPYLDEIELLLFESTHESLPSRFDIRELSLLAGEFDITYDIHLPIDISLGDEHRSVRCSSVDSVQAVIDLTLPLEPSVYTLHLSFNDDLSKTDDISKWQKRVYESMELLLSSGINSRSIAIENLMYPFEWVEEIILSLNLSICIDTGHFILMGTDLKKVFDKHHERVSIIHLHGARDNLDHLSLDKLNDNEISDIMRILKTYEGIVIIEVFSYDNLHASLKYLENYQVFKAACASNI